MTGLFIPNLELPEKHRKLIVYPDGEVWAFYEDKCIGKAIPCRLDIELANTTYNYDGAQNQPFGIIEQLDAANTLPQEKEYRKEKK